jgi:hypothetical protein
MPVMAVMAKRIDSARPAPGPGAATAHGADDRRGAACSEGRDTATDQDSFVPRQAPTYIRNERGENEGKFRKEFQNVSGGEQTPTAPMTQLSMTEDPRQA